MSGQIPGGNQPIDDFRGGVFWLLMHYLCSCAVFGIAKYILSSMALDDFLFWWFGIGLGVLVLYSLATGRILEEKLTGVHVRMIALYCFLDAFGSTAFYLSIKLMAPSVVSFLDQSQLLLTITFGYIFLKETLNRNEIGAALLIITGLVIMTYRSESIPVAGILLMLCANCAGAGSFILIRKIRVSISTLTFARVRALSIFLVFLIYHLFVAQSILLPPMPLFAALVLGGLFGPVLNALKFIPAGRLAIFRSLIPVFVMAIEVVFLGIFPGIRAAAGGVIILAGTMLLAYFYMGNVPTRLRRPVRPLR